MHFVWDEEFVGVDIADVMLRETLKNGMKANFPISVEGLDNPPMRQSNNDN